MLLSNFKHCTDQAIEITKEKGDKIINRLKECFTVQSENNLYINDYIKDFEFAVSQAEQLQTSNQEKYVITPQQINKATENVSVSLTKQAKKVETDEIKIDTKDSKEGEEFGDDN